jgi:multidrug efflux pump subunit AcrA (membrane-fusion protein)
MADSVTASGATAITEAEWTAFQALPAHDDARRGWLDALIAARVAVAREKAVNAAMLALQQARVDSSRTLHIDDAQTVVGGLLRHAYLERTQQPTAG